MAIPVLLSCATLAVAPAQGIVADRLVAVVSGQPSWQVHFSIGQAF